MAGEQSRTAAPGHEGGENGHYPGQAHDGHTETLAGASDNLVLHVDDLGRLLVISLGGLDLLEKFLGIPTVGHGLTDPGQQIVPAAFLGLGQPVKDDSHGPQGQAG